VSDATVLLRDIAGDAATKAADKVSPNEEQLQHLDEPAPDNTWHEKPNLSKEQIRSQIQSRVPIGKKDAKDAAGDATQAANPDGSRDPQALGERAAADQQYNTSSGVDARSGAQAGMQNLKAKVSSNASEEDKQRAREYREKTANYFKQKLPKDRREQLVFRLKKMVVEIQGHQDCESSAIDTSERH
jgi:hypothetical protein